MYRLVWGQDPADGLPKAGDEPLKSGDSRLEGGGASIVLLILYGIVGHG